MKSKLQFLVVMALAVAMSMAAVYGQEQKETLGDKLKRLFSHPSPTPTPRKSHKRSSDSPGASAVASPSLSPGESPPIPTYGETPLPQTEPSTSAEAPIGTKTPETQYFEPVRPINPGPPGRIAPPRSPQSFVTPAATETPALNLPEEPSSEDRPTPSLQTVPIPGAASSGSPEAAPSAQSSASTTPTYTSSATEATVSKPSPPVISMEGISESSSYSPEVRKMIEIGLNLATKDLNYKYASADPANGGLDCSGFIYYVLTKSGVKSVPRDAREQYIWVRKAGNFQAVLGHGDDSFELDSLRPGDLLFWANPSGVSSQPEISQIMIYVGRDKATNQRLMIGASEAGTYKSEKKSGVGVFDFKPGSAEQNPDEPPSSVFAGYGRFPDLSP